MTNVLDASTLGWAKSIYALCEYASWCPWEAVESNENRGPKEMKERAIQAALVFAGASTEPAETLRSLAAAATPGEWYCPNPDDNPSAIKADQIWQNRAVYIGDIHEEADRAFIVGAVAFVRKLLALGNPQFKERLARIISPIDWKAHDAMTEEEFLFTGFSIEQSLAKAEKITAIFQSSPDCPGCESFQQVFDMRWAADQRAIARWQGEDLTGAREMIWPDHADLVVWLLERLDRVEEVYVDENETAWTVPTSWAYAQACKALHKWRDKARVAADWLERRYGHGVMIAGNTWTDDDARLLWEDLQAIYSKEDLQAIYSKPETKEDS